MPTDRTAQNHRAEVDELLAEYRSSRERLAETHRALEAVTAEARSSDGAVRVVVGHQGVLREVVLAEDVYRRLRPAELAATVVRLTGQAAASAAERAAEILADVLPPGADPETFLGETPKPGPQPRAAARPAEDDLEDEDFSQTSWLSSGPAERR
ncbi:YbaB/EbfC family nucleoid-associated protein [Saccharopolyspora griseoalba]|uniref:YbaB/EbfC family nucleoid-associated protein n=1 Tax=Saccharopolyspora griseoalba TaxID=1431848 RepID=A0ABW2LGK7_9PSEU